MNRFEGYYMAFGPSGGGAPNPNFQRQASALNNELHRLNQVKDALGLGIDRGIIETVALLNLNNIPTWSSCEGHLDKGRNMAPYIFVGAPIDNPTMLKMEQNVQQAYADYYDYAAQNPQDTNGISARLNSARQVEAQEYGPMLQHGIELQKLLDQFYQVHQPSSEETRLVVSVKRVTVELVNVGRDFQILLSDADRASHLNDYQAEINAFTLFLRQDFLSR